MGDGDGDGPQMPQLKPGDPLERFFKQFGQRGGKMQHPTKPKQTQAQGSGFFITADGYIVTNNHVVEHATEVQVVTDDGTTLPAKVIGTDKKTDLALLKVTKPGTYPFVNWAEKAPRVGEWVIAVGNPFGLGRNGHCGHRLGSRPRHRRRPLRRLPADRRSREPR